MLAFGGNCCALVTAALKRLAILGFVGFLWVSLGFTFVDGRIRSSTVVDGRWDCLQKHFGCTKMVQYTIPFWFSVQGFFAVSGVYTVPFWYNQ